MSTAVGSEASPVLIGPSWLKNPDGSWLMPDDKMTLGWQVVKWAADNLLQPDGPTAGERWDWTDEQLRLLLWWYAVDDRGRFIYRRGTLRRIKGWGKDPFAAALAAVELLGPCRFGGFDSTGQVLAVAHPAPWVQVAAVSKDQTRNTMSLFPGLFGSKERAKRLGVDLGKEIIYSSSGGRIEAVTSSPRALEGGRPTFVILNETQHWLSNNEGHSMAEAVARNLAKIRDGAARALSITNAHEPGEDSVAEREWDAWLKIDTGKSRATGVLYDSLEAPADTELKDPDSLARGIRVARGDSVWLDVERLVAEVYDPRTPPSMSRRFYLNQVVAAEDAWMAPHEWNACADVGRIVTDGDEIVMFFDGGKTDDATGIVGCRVSDGHLFVVGAWESPDGPAGDGWEVDRDDVDRVVSGAFERFQVAAMYCDVALWESYIDMWRDRYADRLRVWATSGAGKKGHATAWDMRSRVPEFTGAAERFISDVVSGELSHDGDPVLTRHVLNARRGPNRWGVSLRKEHRESSRKIDLAVCAVGARLARRDVLSIAANSSSKRRSGVVVGF
jgi:hypothetical protein